MSAHFTKSDNKERKFLLIRKFYDVTIPEASSWMRSEVMIGSPSFSNRRISRSVERVLTVLEVLKRGFFYDSSD